MIYEFFTDKTTGPLTNFLSGLANMPTLKMIDYTLLEYHTLDLKEYDVKRFTFGYEGNTFKFYLSKSDTIGLSFEDNTMPHTGSFHHFRLYYTGNSINNYKVNDEIRQYLLSFVRDYKLNQIVK